MAASSGGCWRQRRIAEKLSDECDRPATDQLHSVSGVNVLAGNDFPLLGDIGHRLDEMRILLKQLLCKLLCFIVRRVVGRRHVNQLSFEKEQAVQQKLPGQTLALQ